MSIVQSSVRCPQCEYAEAAKWIDRGDSTWNITCRRCGYYEFERRDCNKVGQAQWTHRVFRGAGCKWFQPTDEIGFIVERQDTPADVVRAERWLLDQLEAGRVENTAYLTRWNDEAKQVEMVVGEFYLFQEEIEEQVIAVVRRAIRELLNPEKADRERPVRHY
jgi:hypothetical protein